jgi:hypothetical protein
MPDQKPVIFVSKKVKDIHAPFPPAVNRDEIDSNVITVVFCAGFSEQIQILEVHSHL